MKMIRTILIRFSLCGLLLTFGGTFAIAQQGEEVTGRLISTGGKPVSDVTVSFDGNTAAPAVTDSTGSFSLTVPDGNVWLTITPIAGYKSKSVFLNGRKELTIYLAPRKTKSVHDEVLYTGNNRLKRNILVSTHQKVAGEIDPDPWEGIDQKLQGRVSGLYQVGTSGMPGAGTFMLNQGLRSINTNNQPLVIVDGIPLEAPGLIGSVVSGYVNNPLSSIDVMDISSMTVIKGGAPLASYGVNGSNGVILIQTLKPSETTTSIDFQFKTGMNFSNARMPLLNTEQYKSLAKEVLSTSPYPEEEYMERYPGLFYIPSDDEYLRYSHNTPWQEEVFRNTWMQDAYLAVKGGDAIARYGL